jgi:site-specific recombinase XerD
MEQYISQISKECDLLGLSDNTKKAYAGTFRQFAKFYEGKNPEELGVKEIKEYLSHLSSEKKLEGRSVNRVAAGLKFYYFRVLEKDWKPSLIPRMKQNKTIPTILSRAEVARMIRAPRNIKHRAIVMTLYSTGMRMSELRNLTAADIDSKRMVINIRQGKGAKDRQAILSPVLLDMLRQYWKENKDDKSKYLFAIPSKGMGKSRGVAGKRLSHTAVGYVVDQAARLACVKKNVTPHTLRHSFAVHLVEDGVHLRHIQYLLGHSDVRMTIRYTYIADISKLKAVSPLDGFFKDAKGVEV